MKKILLIFIALPMIGFGQLTYVPNNNFENYLETHTASGSLVFIGDPSAMGNGIYNDNYVFTSNIDTVTSLDIEGYNVANALTGIEDFTALTYFNCANNQITSLDVRNGNNTNFYNFSTWDNPNLTCINVDDATWSTANWTNIDAQSYFSTNCPPSAIQEHTSNTELLKITDLLGREIKGAKNQLLFYIYDDGIVEKKLVIE
jgi:hypothetical protein